VKGLLTSSSNTNNEPSPATRVHFRTSTKFNSRYPEWNETWQIGGVRKGTYIKLKLYDEDPRKALDDKLGSVKFDLDDPEVCVHCQIIEYMLILKKFVGEERILDLSIRDYKGSKHIQLLTHLYDLCHSNAKKSEEANREESTIRVKVCRFCLLSSHAN